MTLAQHTEPNIALTNAPRSGGAILCPYLPADTSLEMYFQAPGSEQLFKAKKTCWLSGVRKTLTKLWKSETVHDRI